MAKFGPRKLLLDDGTVVDVVCCDRQCYSDAGGEHRRCPAQGSINIMGARMYPCVHFGVTRTQGRRPAMCLAAERRYKAQEEAIEHE